MSLSNLVTRPVLSVLLIKHFAHRITEPSTPAGNDDHLPRNGALTMRAVLCCDTCKDFTDAHDDDLHNELHTLSYDDLRDFFSTDVQEFIVSEIIRLREQRDPEEQRRIDAEIIAETVAIVRRTQ